jgi:hypothetical protein
VSARGSKSRRQFFLSGRNYGVYRRKKCYLLNNEHYVILVKLVPPFNGEAQTALFKAPVRTAQKTLFFSVIKTNHFMSYGAEFAVCPQINTKHKNSADRAYDC